MRYSLFPVFLTIFLDLLGFGIIIPVTPYLATAFEASQSQVAWLNAVYSLAQFLCVPLWGRAADRWGRRPVLLVGTLGSAMAMGVFGAATSLPMLFAARAMHGAMTGNIAAAQAYIADATTPERRTQAMGVVGVAFGLGFILGPALGGQLAQWGQALGWSYSLVGYGSAALSLINFVWVFRRLPEIRIPTGASAPSVPGSLGLGRFKLGQWRRWALDRTAAVLPILFLSYFGLVFAFANMESTFSLMTMDRLGWSEESGGVSLNSYVFVLVGFVAATTQGLLVGPLAKKFGDRTLFVAGLWTMALGLLWLAWAPNVPMVLVATVWLSLGNGLAIPTVSALLSHATLPKHRGAVFGVQQSMGALGRVLGPVTGGLLIQYGNDSMPFLCGAIVMAAVAVWGTLTRSAAPNTREPSLPKTLPPEHVHPDNPPQP